MPLQEGGEGRFRAMDQALVDIVIVGYGPVGAAAANLCGRAGLSTLVLERSSEPYPAPRAIHFDAEAMRIFQSVGLADRVAAVTRPLGGSVYLGADGRPIRTFRSHDTRPTLGWPASNLFYQPELEGVLRAGAEDSPHVEVQLGVEVAALRQDVETVTLQTRSEAGARGEVRARYVLACDGASSLIRKSLGVKLDDMRFEERWLVVDAFVSGPMRWPAAYSIPEEVRDGRCSLMICDPAGPATLIPGRGSHRRWEYMLPGPETDAEALQSSTILARLADWIDPAQVEIARAAVYRFHGLVARDWRRGRVFLLGDAAHQTPPFFGQGMCHGLRDAAQLVWKLRLVLDGDADPELLDTYQEERDPHVRAILSASVEAGAAVCILDPVRARERDARFRAEEAARGGDPVAMTDVVPPIRAGVIDPAAAGAGLRLPQPPVAIAGSAVRLDDLLDGRFAILSFEDQPDADELPPDLAAGWTALGGRWLQLTSSQAAPAPEAIHDVAGGLERWIREQGAKWVVVRPDRYVFGAAASHSELARLLGSLFEQLRLTFTPAAERRPPLHPLLEAAS